MDWILVFPGQGSQKPGMARDLAESYPAARRVLDEADAAYAARAGSPLTRLMFDGPADELTRTENAQPALLAHGAAAWAVVAGRIAPRVRAAAGHSLGELTAYHVAGAFGLADAVRLVRARGELMRDTGAGRPGTMAAIIGRPERSIEDICGEASAAGLVVPANYNTDEQVVVSGEPAGVERAMELAREAGAKRTVPLNVSGAFHSPLMASAVAGLRSALETVEWNEPAFPVYSNVDAAPNSSARDARDLLMRQVTSPVRWADVVRALARDFPSAAFLELGPGNVLAGLIKRVVPDAVAHSCGTAADVEKLLTLTSQ